ncbi:heavy metal translocating P-type ATPase [Clostridium tetanomorphum]|uniref:Cadmium-translocating P-type ATPase n=2 Tax=Clostridium TaxID=1485 RepID=A0A923EC67_CLOTT|nr:heavy metal translocating P-type ATPase [Clostridium tetanomorphum]MBC2399096.1 cadmium-translocating P-type ATPase [Clostridium tetanomorphum]NRZ95892.1 Cd2+/Zn2+-exporting ATPase [Clostridium tetanomorphum]
MNKVELILENLDCANCASKIENNVKDIETIKEATLNFISKTLTFETYNGENIDKIKEEIKSIVNKFEPDVIVKEKIKKNNRKLKKEYILENLDCANCVSKIENRIKEIEDIEEATVNFMTKTLTFKLNKEGSLSEVEQEINNIVKKLEPYVVLKKKTSKKTIGNLKRATTCCSGHDYDHDHNYSHKHHHEHEHNHHNKNDKCCSVYEEEHDEHDHAHNHGEDNNKKAVLKLALGGLIFAIGIIGKFKTNIELIIFLSAYIIVGGEIVLRALKNITRGQIFDENFLMTIATVGAFATGEFPEGVAVMLFYQVGELFQDIAVNKSRKSITSLMDIRPDFANLKIDEELVKVSPEEVSVDDIIVVKPGEKIPLDGVIIEGKSMLDTSALTGESIPRNVEEGDEILSGFINQSGVITVKVSKEFGESTVSKILDLVQNASSRKAKAENFITKFARYYTPAVVIVAAALAILPPIFINGVTFAQWVYRASIFLVISCPCALVISIPLGFFGGIGAASKYGILIKGSNYLEALNDVETVVFDKTGTLTQGIFNVTQINSINGFNKDEVLKYAAYAENYSNHPIATSIVKAYKSEINNQEISNYEEIPGHGIIVQVNGKRVAAGNYKLMNDEKVEFQEVDSVGTVVYIAVDRVYAGSIVIEDTIKEDAIKAIKELKDSEVKNTIMLTGDNKKVANKVGNQLQVDEIYAELLPQEKVEKLESIDSKKTPGKNIIFVGDGINDAPVLARADVGVAMGGLGSDAAIEAADVVIMTDEPSKIATAIKISKRTRTIVIQNIVFALGVKALVLILGAFGIATMWEAVFADVGVSVIAILNSMRVMRFKK